MERSRLQNRLVGSIKAGDAVAQCQARLADVLPSMLTELFEHTDDDLYQLADKTGGDFLETQYFAAMRQLRKSRGAIERSFADYQRHAFEAFWNACGLLNAPQELTFDCDELSLVDDNQLEENLAVSGMAQKAENRFHLELESLTRRFAAIAGLAEFDVKQNAVGPTAIAEGFRHAMRQWQGDFGIRLVIYKLFDRHVMAYLGGLYDNLNASLIEVGILPDLKLRVVRNPVSPALLRKSGGRQADPGSGASTAVGENDADYSELLGALASALDRRRTQGERLISGLLPGVGSATDYDSVLPAVESYDVVEALTSLQLKTFAETLSSREQLRHLHHRLVGMLAVRLGLGSHEAPVRRLRREDRDRLDVIATLFDFILDDENIADPMKALLSRLQIPLLKVALLDRAFLRDKRHPARRLMNLIAHAAMGWTDDGDPSAKRMFERIDATVKRVLNEFTHDTGVFQDAVDDLERFFNLESRKAAVAEERVRQLHRGQEQLLVARRNVAEILHAIRETRPDLPGPVVDILREAWHDVMLLALLREGKQSKGWKHAIAVLDKLIWSVLPKDGADERQKMLKLMPTLLKALRKGFEDISLGPRRIEELLDGLQGCHMAVLSGRNPTKAGDGRRGRAVVETNPVAHPDDRGLPQQVAPDAGIESANDEAYEKADALTVGTWLEWQRDQNTVRGKLSWRSSVTGNCIFVNRQGLLVEEMHIERIAQLLHSGEGRVLSVDAAPLVDRALDRMLEGHPLVSAIA